MKQKVLITLFTLLITVISFTNSLENEKWIEDLNYLKTELPKLHKNLFYKISEKEFNSYIDELSSNINKMNNKDVLLSLDILFTKIGDAHTGISYSYSNEFDSFYPFDIMEFEEGFIVVDSSKEYEDIIGSKLIAINGFSIDYIKNQLSKIIPHENEAALIKALPQNIIFPDKLKYLNIIENKDKTFFLFEKNGELILKKILPEKISNRKNIQYSIIKYKPNFLNKYNNSFFDYIYFEDSKIMYFIYNKCYSVEVYDKYPDPRINREQLPSFEKIVGNMLDIIQENDVEKFVIDMRNNPGGSSSMGTNLAKIIGDFDKLKDNVYVVIGRRTFSSAIINTLDFKKYANAKIIGVATSGKPNHFGEIKSFELPNTKYKIFYSTKYFKFLNDDPDSIYPDIEIKMSLNDFLNGEDTIFKFIKNN
ncbi:S41 family peptidase [Oceanotoga teriensis]|uniref:S41 family peptidase n=1 Tax=Oceanotoga teriensis TaxID=515440 RepID=UPI002712CA43|nr:S41 family peptidase [Oceanotoga teriensis]MDO7975754.1 S41 family peptidase [Oceanotoga teriensis]